MTATAYIVKDQPHLTLQPGSVLPDNLSWKIIEGYIVTNYWNEEGETIVLGVWGQGDWVTTAYSALKPIEIQCISTVVVEQFEPTAEDINQLLLQQIKNLEEIFQLNRIRAADQRLITLLTWIGRRFGRVGGSDQRDGRPDRLDVTGGSTVRGDKEAPHCQDRRRLVDDLGRRPLCGDPGTCPPFARGEAAREAQAVRRLHENEFPR